VEGQRLAASCHLGLAWRSRKLDGSLELSTKLLEYGALGLPVLCNPTPMHRRLLGTDYPFFVKEAADFALVLRNGQQPSTWDIAANATRTLAEHHRASKVGADLAAALSEAFA
jgi:hypothetical protein